MPHMSARRRQEYPQYRKLAAQFILDHPYCQHWLAEEGFLESDVMENGFISGVNKHGIYRHTKVPESSEVHHVRGRGKHYLDTSTWMAVRRGHDQYIHKDPLRYAKGYCLPR